MHRPSSSWLRSASVLVTLAMAASGCFFGTPGATGNGNGGAQGASVAASTSVGAGGGGGSNSQATDLAAYDALQTKLMATATMVGNSEGMTGLAPYGDTLFWYQFDTANPTLHSYDADTKTTIDYTFGIGDQDTYNYRMSSTLVVTADTNGDYYAYDVTKANSLVGQLTVTPPSADVQWWAYAPDGNKVYYVTTEGGNLLWEWTPPSATPTQLVDLDKTGATIGEFDDFGVSGNTMVFLADGAVWELDLTTQKAVNLGNTIEDLTGADIESDGVLFPTDDGLEFYANSTMALRNLAAQIQASKYQLNATFSTAHVEDPTRDGYGRYQSRVAYFGQNGIFTYDLSSGAITPILLDARDDSTYWAGVALLSNGTLYTTGLQSNEGDIGASGPVYSVNLAQ